MNYRIIKYHQGFKKKKASWLKSIEAKAIVYVGVCLAISILIFVLTSK